MERIIAAQGPAPAICEPGPLTADILATRDGTVTGIDNLRLNRLARNAGAPVSKGAGIDLFHKIGASVRQGEPLYRIHATGLFEFEHTVQAARINSGYDIA
jgi:thymidine phosphorylase